jgi:hypothetical protein
MKALFLLAALMMTGAAIVAADHPIVDDGEPHGDPPYLLEKGWTPLIQGTSLQGWTFEHPEKGVWKTSSAIYWDGKNLPQQLIAFPAPGNRLSNGPKGAISNIITTQKFKDVELYLEFLIPAKSNSGVYLHGLYEVQVYDSFGVEHPKYLDCGAIYHRWINEKGVGGSPPLVNASRPPGEWQSFHIWFQAPRFDASGRKTANAKFLRVLFNDKLVQKDTEVDGPTRSGLDIPEAPENPLMLQGDHGPVAYRNIYFKPLDVSALKQ